MTAVRVPSLVGWRFRERIENEPWADRAEMQIARQFGGSGNGRYVSGVRVRPETADGLVHTVDGGPLRWSRLEVRVFAGGWPRIPRRFHPSSIKRSEDGACASRRRQHGTGVVHQVAPIRVERHGQPVKAGRGRTVVLAGKRGHISVGVDRLEPSG